MSPKAVVVVVLSAAAFPLLLWAIGRAVTAMGKRVPCSRGRKQYLAGTLHGVRITALVDGGGELLVSLATTTTNESQPPGRPLNKVFRVTARECSLDRVRRWRDENTLLRAYLGHDGALMLADRALGGNAACEPAAVIRQAPKRAASQDRSASEGS
jgi:hypothetical protein